MSSNYYSENAEQFCTSTFDIDMSYHQNRFCDYLPEKASVLDAGCGSGRDALVFVQKGYVVDAFDSSPEIASIAAKNTGIDVKTMKFKDLDVQNRYDGVWANASLLHVPFDEQISTLVKLRKSLKDGGVLYATYKLDEVVHTCDEMGREFTNMTIDRARNLISAAGLSMVSTLVTEDKRPTRTNKWICITCAKPKA